MEFRRVVFRSLRETKITTVVDLLWSFRKFFFFFFPPAVHVFPFQKRRTGKEMLKASRERKTVAKQKLSSRPREASSIGGLGNHSDKMEDLCLDRKSTRLNSSHANISYAVFCLKKKKIKFFIIFMT